MSYPYSFSRSKQKNNTEPLEFDFRTDYSQRELIEVGDRLIEIFPQEKLLFGEKIDWSEIINFFYIDALKEAHPLLLWIAFWGLQKKKRLILDQEFSLGYSKTSTHFKFTLREFDNILLELQVYLFAIIFCLQEDEQELQEDRIDCAPLCFIPRTPPPQRMTYVRHDGEKRFIFGELPQIFEMLFSEIGSLIFPQKLEFSQAEFRKGKLTLTKEQIHLLKIECEGGGIKKAGINSPFAEIISSLKTKEISILYLLGVQKRTLASVMKEFGLYEKYTAGVFADVVVSPILARLNCRLY